MSLNLFKEYVFQQDLYQFNFLFTFQLTNFFLVFKKHKNLITFSKNQTIQQRLFNLKHFQEVLQNTIFLLTFQLTTN